MSIIIELFKVDAGDYHPLFSNLQKGNWLIDYHKNRIQKYDELKVVYDWY